MGFRTWVAGETVTAANVNDYLQKQVVVVCTSGTRPSSPPEGMHIYETDTDKVLAYDGAAWSLPKNRAGGSLGYAEVTANQGSITTEADLTGLSVTVTVATGRRIRITATLDPQSSQAGDAVTAHIKEGATYLQRGDATLTAAAFGESLHLAVILAPSAGSHTYKLSMGRASGTGTITNSAAATHPSFILVEDIGV